MEIAESAPPNPELATDAKLQELAAEHVHVSTRPIAELPPAGGQEDGEGDWQRRNLRPETEGPHFRNAPILRYGVTYTGDQAELSVPDRTYLNALVDVHNPGGFHLVPGNNLESAPEFLAKIARKEFPDPDEAHPLAVSDGFGVFLDPDSEYGPDEPLVLTNSKDHALGDHGGILLLPESVADEFAQFAQILLEHGGGRLLARATGDIDDALDRFSDYAILPHTGGTENERAYKARLRERLSALAAHFQYEANLLFRDRHQKSQEGEAPEEFSFTLDFDAIDENIARMQQL
jgi:hypothetical protein